MSDFNDSVFSNPNLAETQMAIARQLEPIKEAYFVQWQNVHPSSYRFWFNNLEEYAKKELETLNDESSTYTPEPVHDDSDLDLFWVDVIAKINNDGLFPRLESIPLYYFFTPFSSINVTPLQYIVSGIMEPSNKNIFLADIVRVFNIDAIAYPFNYNTWSVELIIRLNNTDSGFITAKDKWVWVDSTIALFYSSTVRQNTGVSLTWMAGNIHQFIESFPQNQSYVETALRIITKEQYHLDEDTIRYIGHLIRVKWFNKKYLRRLKAAIKSYYKKSFDRDVIVDFSASQPSSSDPPPECPGWKHGPSRVFWKSSSCTCDNKTMCMLKNHTIFSLKTCNCDDTSFCILRGVQSELNRLNTITTNKTILI